MCGGNKSDIVTNHVEERGDHAYVKLRRNLSQLSNPQSKWGEGIGAKYKLSGN